MTEIPFAEPNVIQIGSTSESSSWANMGHPRRTPRALVDYAALAAFTADIDAVEEFTINFRSHDLKPFTDATSLALRGFLVFTGEPHLVFFLDDHPALDDIAKTLFASSGSEAGHHYEKRVNFGSWLIDHIGNYLNKHYATTFPKGVNVNFVRVNRTTQEVEYRCFERGIDRETLACGTGALAVAYIVQRREWIAGKRSIVVVPHRCTWYEPTARLRVEQGDDGWIIHGNPALLYTGAFRQPGSRTHTDAGKALRMLGQTVAMA